MNDASNPEPSPSPSPSPSSVPLARATRKANPFHLAVGIGVVGVAIVLAIGAWSIPSNAGYGGVGPNFLPWLVSAVLAGLGLWLIKQALSGGYLALPTPSGLAQGNWPALAWVSAGILANAALITTLGFVLSCGLCFALAVRGLRVGEGRHGGSWAQTAKDFGVGLAIAAPVFWLFTKVLAINLPGLTKTGWL